MIVVSIPASASDWLKSSNECTRYQLEEGAAMYIRPSFAGNLSRRLEVGSPKDFMSIELIVPNPDLKNFPVLFKSARVSAFFRPLGSGEPECEAAPEMRAVQCYRKIPSDHSQPVQILVTFDLSNDVSEDPVALTNQVVAILEKTALACPDTVVSDTDH
jgi:hypothetical protein